MTVRSVRIVCPECRAELQVNQQALGRKMRCPHCDALITAAEPPPEPPPVAPPVVRWTTTSEPTPPPLPPEPAVVIDGALPGVKKKASRAFVEADMDMTPMVDVVFQLLIFFMLTAAFTITKSQQFPKPQQSQPAVAPAQPEDDPDFVIIRIDNGNTFHVSGGDLGPDEIEAASPVELLIRLKQSREGLSGKIPTKLLVKAHGDCTHERVVAAIDAGNDVGIEEVKVQTIEDEE
jgi:biopolymer transport protein ExbD